MAHKIPMKIFSCAAAILFFYGAAYGAPHFPAPAVTESSCDFLGAFKLDGADAQPGDEVAFLDPQGVLCGSFVVTVSGSYGIVHVYGDDLTTSGTDEGASPGDVLTIKIWDAGRGMERAGELLSLSGGTPPSGSSFLPSVVPPVWQSNSGFVLNIDTATHFVPPAPTPYISDYAGALVVSGAPAQVGDEVAVYDSIGVLCGHSRVTIPGQYGIIHIYGDDPDTESVDEGAVENDVLTFKIWDKSAGLEYEGGNLLLTPGVTAGSTFLPSAVPPVWNGDTGFLLNIEAAAGCITPPPGIVSWWKGEGNATDQAGANHGTLVNGAAFAAGKVGQAFRLDGIDDYVRVPDSPQLNIGAGDFSLSLWASYTAVKPGSNPTNLPNVFIGQDQGAGSLNKWVFFSADAGLYFHMNGSGQRFVGPASFTPQTGRWYQFSLTRSGSVYSFYVDGMMIGGFTDSTPVPDVGAPLTIGQAEGLGYFNGLIDEVAIYNRALSESEIQAVYNAGSSGLCGITHPSVVEVSPTNGLTGVAVDTVITAVFSEDMDPATITGSTFTVSHGVTGTVSYDSAFRIATFSPSSNLAYGTTYTVTIDTGMKDLDGNHLPSEYTWTFTTPAICADLPPGIVSWWKGERNANDNAGWNHGTAANGTAYAAGAVGQAFDLDGVDDHVSIPNIVDDWSQGTIEAWVKYNDTAAGSAGTYIFSAAGYQPLGAAGSWDVTDLGIHPGAGPDLRFGLTGSWQWAASGVIPVVGRWYHVAGTWGADGMAIYIDGELKGTNPYNGPSGASNYNIIGASSWPGSSFNGTIDELKIFDRPLTAAEIRAIYSAGNLGVCDTSAPSIISVNPANGITDFSVDAIVTAVFNEDMDASTITDLTFTVSGGVMGTVTYDIGARTASFTPSSNLSYGTAYTAAITSGVKDLAGNPMASSYLWTFTTGNLPADSDQDGMDDAWEIGAFGDLSHGSTDDADGDGLTDLEEFEGGTDPNAPDAMPLLTITPEGRAFFRTSTDDRLSREFEIAGGLPFAGPVNYYQLEVVSEQDGSQPPVDVFQDQAGAFLYRFETFGRSDGVYFIRAIDRRAAQVISQPVLISTLSQTTVASTPPAQAGSSCALTVSNPGGSFNGSSIAVPSDANTGGLILAFSTVDSGAPFVSAGELHGPVIHLEATDLNGDRVGFGSPVMVTLFYGGMIGDMDPLDLVIIHFNEEEGRWERVTSVTIDAGAQTLAFQTLSFSLYGVVTPGEPRLSLTGGSSQADFAMISIPGQPLRKNLRDHLESSLGAYDDTLWRLFAYDPATGGYVEAAGDDLDRFNDRFGLAPGQGYWVISRSGGEVTIPSLAFDEEVGSVFQTVLYPGWNMVSHPWATDVDLGSHEIQVSTDGTDWHSVDEMLHNGPFYRFLGREGSGGHWYENLFLAGSDQPPSSPDPPDGSGVSAPVPSRLKPYQSYWLQNRTNPPQPVFMRMKKLNDSNDAISLQSMEVPGHLRMLAAKWIEKALFSGIRTCIAQSAGDQPPDPPAVESGRRTIGVAGGGGGCFIGTAHGPVGNGRRDMTAGGLILFLLLVAALRRDEIPTYNSRTDERP